MNYDVTTVIWVLIASALIYFMQAGFALCEAGLTRAKNTGNILMKNLMDEEPDGFLYRNAVLLAGRLRNHVRKHRSDYRAAGSDDPRDLRR